MPKPLAAALAAAFVLLLDVADALGAPPTGEKTPVNLNLDSGSKPSVSGGSTGGSLVRTFVGLAIVIAVIYGLYWVLKQVKSSREEKASGQGLSALATLPLGANRSLQLVRAGREIVLVGVSEHGVTPVRTYSEDEAEAVGLLDEPDDDEPGSGGSSSGGALGRVLEDLRRRTVR
ncbi:MAG: flagellar protein FliO/FliZ [Thermoleophilaceae bacterium]|jgi:flagellar protein FliO/FliZ|nr:flagellar protein FliO/FliZ [Thermoleophilaceae bacterium]